MPKSFPRGILWQNYFTSLLVVEDSLVAKIIRSRKETGIKGQLCQGEIQVGIQS